MVLARFFNEIIVFSMVLIGFSMVSFGFSLDLLVFITRVLGFILAILRSHSVLDWFYSGFGQVVWLWHTQERVAGQRRSRAPKSFKMIVFQSFSEGFPGEDGDRPEH